MGPAAHCKLGHSCVPAAITLSINPVQPLLPSLPNAKKYVEMTVLGGFDGQASASLPSLPLASLPPAPSPAPWFNQQSCETSHPQQ